jgi:hypothetical protein
MFTYETADQKEVRRFRIAQFNGRMATVTGFVRSVLEQESSMPPRWTITIIPNTPKEELKPLRPSSRARPFAEDYF